MDELLKLVGFAVLGLFVIIVFSFLFAIITQMAWDGSVAQIFHLKPLTFWQAFWLNVFGGQVFKSSAIKHNPKS